MQELDAEKNTAIRGTHLMIETSEVQLLKVVAKSGATLLDNRASLGNEQLKRTIQTTGFEFRAVENDSSGLFEFLLPVAQEAALGFNPKAVIAATFSNEVRFPSLAVRIASALGLDKSTPAFDLQMACSAYPYAIYLASKLSRDLRGEVLVIDADLQSRFLDSSDLATSLVMDDAASATIVKTQDFGKSYFDFLSSYSTALECPSTGPIKMDGFKVFSFVASDIVKFLRPLGSDFDLFIPHRANLYMVRQLAKSLSLEDKLVAAQSRFANQGSASIPLTIASSAVKGRALLAGFGAGFSASCAVVTIL